jgi:NADP-dependent 3-hydroxy acid dehydrogenase YdfG
VAHICNTSYIGSIGRRILCEASLENNLQQKGFVWSVAQVMESLSSKVKILSSNPSTAKKENDSSLSSAGDRESADSQEYAEQLPKPQLVASS